MSYKIPEPNGQHCVYCGEPIENHEACVASKPKRSKVWLFAHMSCAYPKTKEADKGGATQVTQLEKDIEKKLRLMVERHGGLCLKWVCPGWSGVPDRIILLPGGHILFAETKRPKGGKVEKLQQWWRKKLNSLGFKAYIVWSVEDIEALDWVIKDMLAEITDPHKPLTREPGESEDDFTDRVVCAVCRGDLTSNAGRASLGLPCNEKETTT